MRYRVINGKNGKVKVINRIGTTLRKSEKINDELRKFFDKQNHPKNLFKTKKWKEARDEHIGDECEHCGSKEDLHLHHTGSKPNWRWVWYKIAHELFLQSDYYTLDKYGVKTCPECGRDRSQGLVKRKTKKPTYRCSKCGIEFKDQEMNIRRSDSKINNSECMAEFLKFAEDNREIITEFFEKYYRLSWKSYLNMENTITLCSKCHFLTEKKVDFEL
ncbi:MAG: hypothetical protein ACOCSL_04490 [Thermoplasmatota archaeon]